MSRNILTSALFGLAAIVALSGCTTITKGSFEDNKGNKYGCTIKDSEFFSSTQEIRITLASGKQISYKWDFTGSYETLAIPSYGLDFSGARELVMTCKRYFGK